MHRDMLEAKIVSTVMTNMLCVMFSQ